MMLNRKRITAWVLSLAFSFGMSASLPNQVSAKHKPVKGDVYINVKKDRRNRREEEQSVAKRVGLALTGVFLIIAGAIITVAEKSEGSGRGSETTSSTTYTPHGSYTTTRTTHSPGSSGSSIGAFVMGMGTGLAAGASA